MVSKLDLRSFVVGAIVCLAAVAIFGAAPETAAINSPNPEIRRFQLRIAATSSNIDAFVLDTVTGKVWERGLNVGKQDSDFFKAKVGAEVDAK